jgi:polyisoprenyl-phosphate glycosyltransferase
MWATDMCATDPHRTKEGGHVDRNPAQLLVICPIYNEEQNVLYFFDRIKNALAQLDPREYSFRLLFTNNRSTDNSLAIVAELSRAHDWVGYLTLSRNHGYQLSVLAGLSTVDADLYMICDVDCEDPPEMVHQFLAEIRRGHDLAYGIRNDREDSWLLGRCRSLFYFALRALGDYRIVPYMAEFSLFKRCVRDVAVSSDNSAPFLRAEFGFAGFNISGVPYRRHARRYGKTHYNFLNNVRFALAGILSSTTFPLRAVFYLMPVVCLLNLALIVRFLFGEMAFETAVVTLLTANALYVGVALAFIAIYLARTYQNGIRRQRFIVDQSQSSLSPFNNSNVTSDPGANPWPIRARGR